MSAIVLRGDARSLPLPDESVDLIVTSPPYWSQRDYRDGGESLAGQIGSEETWQEYLANLLDCDPEDILRVGAAVLPASPLTKACFFMWLTGLSSS